MTDHLGYEKHDAAGRGSGNSGRSWALLGQDHVRSRALVANSALETRAERGRPAPDIELPPPGRLDPGPDGGANWASAARPVNRRDDSRE